MAQATRQTDKIRTDNNTYDEPEKKITAILRIISKSSKPLGSITIARELERYGIFLSERAVRYHLKITDVRGYTQSLGRAGRMLTPQGLEELHFATAPDQVGFIQEKLELLSFQTTFDPATKKGKVAINVSLIDKSNLNSALSMMKDAVRAGFCVSDLVYVANEGDKIGEVSIPRGKVGLATVCSVTINGVLINAGVPIESRFGGVLEIREGRPRRFVAIINYAGTSLDPSEQYIRAGMTSVSEVISSGNGRILANFREIPAPSKRIVEDITSKLENTGIGGLYMLGNTGQPLCQIATGTNRIGVLLLGGLNPVALMSENGIEIDTYAESGVMDYRKLTSLHNIV